MEQDRARVGEAQAVALVVQRVEHGAVEPAQRPAAGGDPGGVLQRREDEARHVVGLEPVVGIEEADELGPRMERVQGAHAPGEVALVLVGVGQDDVLAVPSVDLGLGESVRDDDVPAGHVLGEHALVPQPDVGEVFLVVGRDERDLHGFLPRR